MRVVVGDLCDKKPMTHLPPPDAWHAPQKWLRFERGEAVGSNPDATKLTLPTDDNGLVMGAEAVKMVRGLFKPDFLWRYDRDDPKQSLMFITGMEQKRCTSQRCLVVGLGQKHFATLHQILPLGSGCSTTPSMRRPLWRPCPATRLWTPLLTDTSKRGDYSIGHESRLRAWWLAGGSFAGILS